MTLLRLAAVMLAALTLPEIALAGTGAASFRDTPVRPGAVSAPGRFDLVGLRWKGPGAVEFRVRAVAGGWSVWRRAAPEAEDLPDAGSAEARRAGWKLGNPWWVGAADGLEVRPRGRVTTMRAAFVRSPEVRIPLRRLAAPGRPEIVPRVAWGANEAIRRAEPAYAPELRFAVVHHTAGSNAYSRGEAAAVVRGIQLFHVKSNGWNDIGYNFLVDRFGTIYEGRYGGIDRNVVGAHALGFNTGSVGVAVMGNFIGGTPPPAVERAVAELLAWRLDLAHVDPLSTLSFVSGGSERYVEGTPVTLRAVSGHRDTGLTACPGDAFYVRLGRLATQSAAIGAPKLYEPRVTGVVGGAVRFRARLSESLPWTVTVTDAAGAAVASGSGIGKDVDWTWDATLAPLGPFRWEIAAGEGDKAVTPATGTFGSTTTGALAFTGATVAPQTITPNGDGQGDTATLTYTITAPANVSATVVDGAGLDVATLEPPRWRRAGEHALVFDGLELPDGNYEVRLLARAAGGVEATIALPVSITRTLGTVARSPAVFSPNGDGRHDKLAVTFALTGEATVTVRVLRDGKWVATPFSGVLAGGGHVVRWDGAKRIGRLRDGEYEAVVEATDSVATARTALPFSSDTHAPRVRLLSRKPAKLWVSEPARLTVTVNGARRSIAVARAGDVRIRGIREVRTLVVVARDAAGNVAAPLTVR